MIYHITTREAWQDAAREGSCQPPSLAHEGFIHCSYRNQLAGTAARYFSGQAGLVLLHIDPGRIEGPLRFESTGTGDVFPHLYGPLNLDAVVQVTDFDPQDPEKSFDS